MGLLLTVRTYDLRTNDTGPYVDPVAIGFSTAMMVGTHCRNRF
jgi:hypothetical protein